MSQKLCPIMSRPTGSRRGEDGLQECVEQCALWDPLLKCCCHMSPVLGGRAEIRRIISEFVTGFEHDMVMAEQERDETEMKALEADPPDARLVRRVGELQGAVNAIGQVCEILRRRFMI